MGITLSMYLLYDIVYVVAFYGAIIDLDNQFSSSSQVLLTHLRLINWTMDYGLWTIYRACSRAHLQRARSVLSCALRSPADEDEDICIEPRLTFNLYAFAYLNLPQLHQFPILILPLLSCLCHAKTLSFWLRYLTAVGLLNFAAFSILLEDIIIV